jgi:peptidoglycan/LPS O-acetylase OafA/YrhL
MTTAIFIRRVAQAWLLLLVVGSLQPSRPGPVHAHHRAVHFAAFGGGAFLLLLLARSRREELRAAIAVCLLGLCLEFLQHVVYGNVMEWWDVRDDTLAVLGAVFVYYIGARLQLSRAARP